MSVVRTEWRPAPVGDAAHNVRPVVGRPCPRRPGGAVRARTDGDRSGPGRPGDRLRRFFRSDIAGSWVLVLAVGIALLWANSPWGSTYQTVWGHSVRVGAARRSPSFTTVQSLGQRWADGRVLLRRGPGDRPRAPHRGARSRPHRRGPGGRRGSAAWPGPGWSTCCSTTAEVGSSGWGIPMATDIAFALGALALLGRRVPSGSATPPVDPGRGRRRGLGAGAGRLLLVAHPSTGPTRGARGHGGHGGGPSVVGAPRLAHPGRRRWLLWVLLAAGGVEPALAGVVAGVLVPSRRAGCTGDPRRAPRATDRPDLGLRRPPAVRPGQRRDRLPRRDADAAGGHRRCSSGSPLARVVGKLVGITVACSVVVRLGLGRLPEGVRWSHVAGGAAVAGIGFTVPLLIAEQAFATDPPLVAAVRVGPARGVGGWPSAWAHCCWSSAARRTGRHRGPARRGGRPDEEPVHPVVIDDGSAPVCCTMVARHLPDRRRRAGTAGGPRGPLKRQHPNPTPGRGETPWP